MPGNGLSSGTNVTLSFGFILYGLLAFITAQLILLFNTGLLTDGIFRIPPIWMAAHFLLLGFVVMIIMGAMYQLVPVAFLTSIWNETFGFIQMIITIIGVSLFAILLGTMPEYAIYGAILVVTGILMFIMQMFLTISGQKEKNMMTVFVLGAIISFLLTVIVGFFLVWNIAFEMILDQDALLFSHMLFGVAGFFTLLIFGFSYKLIPMFSLSHGFSMKWSKSAFVAYGLGLIVLIASFWMEVPSIQTLGWGLLFLGFTGFVLDIREILQKRLRRRLDKPISFAVLAIVIGYAIHFIAFIFKIFNIHQASIWGWLIFLYIIGWVIFSILGYLYKIIPFLWWTHKYADQMGKGNVPTLAQMVNEKWAMMIYITFIVGISGLIISVLLQIGVLVFVFQALLTLTTIAYVSTIIRIFNI